MSCQKSPTNVAFYGALSLLSLSLAGCYGGPSSSGAGGSSGSPEDLLKGIVTVQPPDTPESLAAKKNKLEANLKLAREVAAKGDLDQSIALLEESLGLDPDHADVMFLLIQNSQTRAKEIAKEDLWRSYRLIVQAGGYMRRLKDNHKDFSKEEQELMANVLFDEACAHARSNRHEEFSGAFSAALGAGFANIERLKSEPDLELFRKVPEMNTLINKAIETLSATKPGS